MGAMVASDDEVAPLYLGDYPHGSYWSAARPSNPTDGEEREFTVEGTDLRIMWDSGAGPLWARGDGLLPDDPEWMRRALRLSDSLVADLLTWRHQMDIAQHPPTKDLDEAAGQLAVRLQAEVGSRFEVRYVR